MSCFALISIPSNFVIQLALQTVSSISSTLVLKMSCLISELKFDTVSPFNSALVLTMSCLILLLTFDITEQIYIVCGTINNKIVRRNRIGQNFGKDNESMVCYI